MEIQLKGAKVLTLLIARDQRYKLLEIERGIAERLRRGPRAHQPQATAQRFRALSQSEGTMGLWRASP